MVLKDILQERPSYTRTRHCKSTFPLLFLFNSTQCGNKFYKYTSLTKKKKKEVITLSEKFGYMKGILSSIPSLSFKITTKEASLVPSWPEFFYSSDTLWTGDRSKNYSGFGRAHPSCSSEAKEPREEACRPEDSHIRPVRFNAGPSNAS